VAIATACSVYTRINGLRQLQDPSSWSLRHHASCICNGQTHSALQVEQTAVYECKRLLVRKLCNMTCCETNSWSPTLADNREVLEHRYAAKQHSVHSIWGMHKGDLERGMLKQQPTLDITHLNRYQVRAQVDKVKSHFIQSPKDNIAECYHLHCSESDAECLEFTDYLFTDNKYLFPVAERVEGGIYGPNPTRQCRKLLMNGQRPLFLLAEAISGLIYIIFYHRVNNHGKYTDGFYNSMIDDKDSHIPSPLIMFTCTALCHAPLKWQKNTGVLPKASKSMLKADRPDHLDYFNYKNDGGKNPSRCTAMGRKVLTLPAVEDM